MYYITKRGAYNTVDHCKDNTTATIQKQINLFQKNRPTQLHCMSALSHTVFFLKRNSK